MQIPQVFANLVFEKGLLTFALVMQNSISESKLWVGDMVEGSIKEVDLAVIRFEPNAVNSTEDLDGSDSKPILLMFFTRLGSSYTSENPSIAFI